MIKKYQSIVKKTLLERARLLLILCQCELELKSKFRLMCEGEYLNVSVISLGSPLNAKDGLLWTLASPLIKTLNNWNT